jgi:hypothetical protein
LSNRLKQQLLGLYGLFALQLKVLKRVGIAELELLRAVRTLHH